MALYSVTAGDAPLRHSQPRPAASRVTATAWVLAVVPILLLSKALPTQAQSFPAGVQGTWKITKLLVPEHGRGGACSEGTASVSALNRDQIVHKYVILRDGTAMLEGHQPQAVATSLQSMDAPAFAAHYLLPAASAKELHLAPGKVQVIDLGAPRSFPFSTLIVQSPSTLIFGACGYFYQAIHDNGFQAPKLPE